MSKNSKNLGIIVMISAMIAITGCSEKGSIADTAFDAAKEIITEGSTNTTTVTEEKQNIEQDSNVELKETSTGSIDNATESKESSTASIDSKFYVHKLGDSFDVGNDSTTFNVKVDNIFAVRKDDTICVDLIYTNTGDEESFISPSTFYGDDFELRSTIGIVGLNEDGIYQNSASIRPGRKAIIRSACVGRPEDYEKIELQVAEDIVIDVKSAFNNNSNTTNSSVIEDQDQKPVESTPAVATNENIYTSWIDDAKFDLDKCYYTCTVYSPSDGYANIRRGPGTEYDVICELDNGTVLTVLDHVIYDDGKYWLRVLVSNEAEAFDGYVSEKMVV